MQANEEKEEILVLNLESNAESKTPSPTSSPYTLPNQDHLIAQLKLQIEELQQLNTVLTPQNYQDYLQKYQALLTWLPTHGYIKDQFQQLDMLFDSFDFLQNEHDERSIKLLEILNELRSLFQEESVQKKFNSILTEPSHCKVLYTMLYFTMRAIQQKESIHLPIRSQMQALVELQIDRLHAQLTNLLPLPPAPPIDHNIPQAVMTPPFPPISQGSIFPNPATLSTNTLLILAGSGLVSTCVLLNLSPKFAMLLGIHLSPPMFVLLVVIGAGMVAYGLSQKEPDPTPTIDRQKPSWFSLEFWKSGCGFWSSEPVVTQPAHPSSASHVNAPSTSMERR